MNSSGFRTTCLTGNKQYPSTVTCRVSYVVVLVSPKVPVLFLLFINDLPTATEHSFINLFADDTSMHGAERDLDSLEVLLQQDIANICRWFYDNKLIVNTRKTCVLKVGSRHKVNTSRELRLHLNGNILDQVDSALYLGCTIDQYILWETNNLHLCVCG